jgi:2-oxoglutarate ferredoxin oxidoreductase subunit alpha
VKPAPLPKGNYRSVGGNEALALGLVAASQKAGIPLFYGSYPITPASSILQYLAGYKKFGVKTFQAEDEIAAICAAIGASYGGNLAVTGTSGPGIALKAEAAGLAVMLEIPLVIINVQRGGPSTGLPTKTEQADLLQAVYGRNGECPMPVLSAGTPADCFEVAFEACRIAIEHMTPVLLLSDGYLANGAEPWRYPSTDNLPAIEVNFAKAKENGIPFLPYSRDDKLAREWALPGTAGLAYRIGGLEKEAETGNISYAPANHEYMVNIRAAKVDKIADFLPEAKISTGANRGDLLFLSWGSTSGVCDTVTRRLLADGHEVGHLNLRHLRPLPRNLSTLLGGFRKIIIPEINAGQLSRIIRDQFLLDTIGFNKVQGLPIAFEELYDFARSLLVR